MQGDISTYTVPFQSINQLIQEDLQHEELNQKLPIGRCLHTQIQPQESEWQTIGDFKVWRKRLRSDSAKALKITLFDFELPDNTVLFAYSEDKSIVMGPFTSVYNVESQVLPIPMIKGETVIIECVFDSKKNNVHPNFIISRISHIYRNITPRSGTPIHDEFEPFPLEGKCTLDINCQVGIGYQIEKRAVARILFEDDTERYRTGFLDLKWSSTFSCSGALVNTTNSSAIPYYLTANHCIDSDSEAASATVYFNFEKAPCITWQGRIDYVMCGAKLRATDTYPISSDFTLLELNARVPSSYQPFFAGWNRSTHDREETVLIHHPGGHDKKISFSTSGASLNQNQITDNSGNLWHDTQTVWDYTHTLGGNEGGSSGSPLFDVKNTPPRIIGHLSTSIGECRNQSYAGAFSASWDLGGTLTTQLKDWLDPNNPNTSPIEMEGYSPQGWLLTELGGYPIPNVGATNSNTVYPPFYIQEDNDTKVHDALKSIAAGIGNQTFYRGKDNKMQVIYPSNSGNASVPFVHAYLDQNGKKVKGDMVVGDGNQLFYRGAGGDLWTYHWLNGSWHNAKISGSNQEVKNEPGSIAIGANNQIFYRGTDDELHTYYYNNGTWYHGIMGNLNSTLDNIIGDIVVDKNNNRVIYVGEIPSNGPYPTPSNAGILHQFEYINGAWVYSTLLPSYIYVLKDCGSLTMGNNSQIFYVNYDEDLYTATFDGTIWNSTFLATDAVSTTSNIVATKGSSNQVMYRDKYSGRMKVSYESSLNNWSTDYIETSWQAPSIHNPEGSIDMADNGHIFYRSDLGLLYRYHWADYFTKSNSNNDYLSMDEIPLSPTLPILEDIGNILNIVIRPNPVQDKFAVDIYVEAEKEWSQLIIYDNMGKQVLFEEAIFFEGKNTIELDFTGYHSGVYYIKVIDKNGKHLSKSILKR